MRKGGRKFLWGCNKNRKGNVITKIKNNKQ